MIKLSEEDLQKYKDLVRSAQNTSVIFIEGRSLADMAWQSVQHYMKDMADKYGYEYLEHVINIKTGEVITIQQAKELEATQENE